MYEYNEHNFYDFETIKTEEADVIQIAVGADKHDSESREHCGWPFYILVHFNWLKYCVIFKEAILMLTLFFLCLHKR